MRATQASLHEASLHEASLHAGHWTPVAWCARGTAILRKTPTKINEKAREINGKQKEIKANPEIMYFSGGRGGTTENH